MKLSEVVVGGRYTAKVSVVVVVKVVAIEEVPAKRGAGTKTRIDAVNETTGQRITLGSAQRLRSRLGCEFCEKKTNRPKADFVCPYCHKTWHYPDQGAQPRSWLASMSAEELSAHQSEAARVRWSRLTPKQWSEQAMRSAATRKQRIAERGGAEA